MTMTPAKRARRRVLGGMGALAVGACGTAATGRATASDADALDVVVIGAGLAGLTAGRDLLLSGNKSFVVLEARARVGGRTLNHKLLSGHVADAGAEWIGPGQTAIANLAQDLGIETFYSRYAGKMVMSSGRGRVALDMGGTFTLDDPSILSDLETMAKHVDPARPWLSPNAAQLDRTSFGSWLQSKRPNDTDFLSYWAACTLTTGAGIFDYSLLHYLSLVNSAKTVQGVEAVKGGAQERRFRGGSQALSLKMSEILGDRVVLDRPVTSIEGWNESVVRVVAGDRIYKARAVIVALSPALCQTVKWSPQLPPMRAELQRRWPAHGAIMKSTMVYSTPFWLDAGQSGQVIRLKGPVIYSYDDTPEDRSFGAIGAFHRLGDTPSDPQRAQAAVAKVLAEAIGDKRFLQPLEFHIKDWGQERYSLTCTPPMPPGLLTSGLMPALIEPMGGVVWAGTETGDRFMLFMEGAVRSGHRAALIALQRLASLRGASL
jgi:monoamine oxidase